jgi:uncharacterized protein YndB with AHSA1/START domain
VTARSIEVDQFLAHPPARVWKALTDPNQLSRWLMPNDFRLKVGHRFHFEAGDFGSPQCEVLAIEQEKMLCVAWRNRSLNTILTWKLEPEGRGTRLFVDHRWFDTDDDWQRAAFEAMSTGWGGHVVRQLSDLLDENLGPI